MASSLKRTDSSTSSDVIEYKLARIESKLGNLKRLVQYLKENQEQKGKRNRDDDGTQSAVSECNSIQEATESERPTSASMEYTDDEGLKGDQSDFIYSQVASFISQNEQHPHFLIAIFSLLKFFDSDHLRIRALQAIEKVVERGETFEKEELSEVGKPEFTEESMSKNSLTGFETTDTYSSYDELQETAIHLEGNFKKMKDQAKSLDDEVKDELYKMHDEVMETFRNSGETTVTNDLISLLVKTVMKGLNLNSEIERRLRAALQKFTGKDLSALRDNMAVAIMREI